SVLLPDLHQDLSATAGRSFPDESEKSDEYVFLVEQMPAVQVPLGATILIPGRGPEMDEFRSTKNTNSSEFSDSSGKDLPALLINLAADPEAGQK
ncbi:hypothetical protein, partial [Flavobacterium sp.]|uniref:hypothetical protein n=1 Tax=Flavobacterium sp. TaxID=239 RepID=UPI00374D4B3C